MAHSLEVDSVAGRLAGAAIGGCVGYFVFGWVLGQGFYAMIIPGAALGYGAGKLSREESVTCGVISAILATGLGLFTEWRFFPFVKDGSLVYFIGHIHELRPVAMLMIGAGGYFGYHFGRGNNAPADRSRDRPESSIGPV
jgi:hypothetical protein